MNNFMGKNQFSNPYYNTNPISTQSAIANNIIWVQGIEGAKAWQLSPNSMVILLDSEIEGKMYIKVSDNIGMCSLRIFDYVEELPSTNVTNNNDLDLSQYVKKDELDNLIKEIIANEQSVQAVTSPTGECNTNSRVITIKK